MLGTEREKCGSKRTLKCHLIWKCVKYEHLPHVPVSVAEGMLVGFVRAEPGSANEARYIFEGRGAGRVIESWGEEPNSKEEGSKTEGEGREEGKLWGLQVLLRAADRVAKLGEKTIRQKGEEWRKRDQMEARQSNNSTGKVLKKWKVKF